MPAQATRWPLKTAISSVLLNAIRLKVMLGSKRDVRLERFSVQLCKSCKGGAPLAGCGDTTSCLGLHAWGLPLRTLSGVPRTYHPGDRPSGSPSHLQPQLPQPYLAQLGRGSPLCWSPFLCPQAHQALVPLLWSSPGPVGGQLHGDVPAAGHSSLYRGCRMGGLARQTLFGFKVEIALLFKSRNQYVLVCRVPCYRT